MPKNGHQFEKIPTMPEFLHTFGHLCIQQISADFLLQTRHDAKLGAEDTIPSDTDKTGTREELKTLFPILSRHLRS